ncbi:fumarate/nitrate reduction transcriptional regulator Fnr [Paraburkholderia sp. A1RI_3L]|uniref:fumarate/nitrate reduction transcriptional regulator Fnr n=1 Tax=Paraburkholderia TaxID=1822464 RepID=UPI0039A70428
MYSSTACDVAVSSGSPHTGYQTYPIAPVDAPADTRADTARRAVTRCSTCSMRAICLPPSLTTAELERLDSIICTTRNVRRGEALYRGNDAFQSIYAVRVGSFKTVVIHRDGREQVTGFQIAGDAMGLDGVYAGRHSCDAVALEDSQVCIIPFGLLEVVCREVKSMQHHVHQMMSGEIVRESGLMMLLGTMSAEQRLATFLLNLSSRFKSRGYSASEFHLRMTREEIGCYLGMKLETVSRMFSKFQREKLVDTHGKQIRITNMEGLARV